MLIFKTQRVLKSSPNEEAQRSLTLECLEEILMRLSKRKLLSTTVIGTENYFVLLSRCLSSQSLSKPKSGNNVLQLINNSSSLHKGNHERYGVWISDLNYH